MLSVTPTKLNHVTRGGRTKHGLKKILFAFGGLFFDLQLRIVLPDFVINMVSKLCLCYDFRKHISALFLQQFKEIISVSLADLRSGSIRNLNAQTEAAETCALKRTEKELVSCRVVRSPGFHTNANALACS